MTTPSDRTRSYALVAAAGVAVFALAAGVAGALATDDAALPPVSVVPDDAVAAPFTANAIEMTPVAIDDLESVLPDVDRPLSIPVVETDDGPDLAATASEHDRPPRVHVADTTPVVAAADTLTGTVGGDRTLLAETFGPLATGTEILDGLTDLDGTEDASVTTQLGSWIHGADEAPALHGSILDEDRIAIWSDPCIGQECAGSATPAVVTAGGDGAGASGVGGGLVEANDDVVFVEPSDGGTGDAPWAGVPLAARAHFVNDLITYSGPPWTACGERSVLTGADVIEIAVNRPDVTVTDWVMGGHHMERGEPAAVVDHYFDELDGGPDPDPYDDTHTHGATGQRPDPTDVEAWEAGVGGPLGICIPLQSPQDYPQPADAWYRPWAEIHLTTGDGTTRRVRAQTASRLSGGPGICAEPPEYLEEINDGLEDAGFGPHTCFRAEVPNVGTRILTDRRILATTTVPGGLGVRWYAGDERCSTVAREGLWHKDLDPEQARLASAVDIDAPVRRNWIFRAAAGEPTVLCTQFVDGAGEQQLLLATVVTHPELPEYTVYVRGARLPFHPASAADATRWAVAGPCRGTIAGAEVEQAAGGGGIQYFGTGLGQEVCAGPAPTSDTPGVPDAHVALRLSPDAGPDYRVTVPSPDPGGAVAVTLPLYRDGVAVALGEVDLLIVDHGQPLDADVARLAALGVRPPEAPAPLSVTTPASTSSDDLTGGPTEPSFVIPRLDVEASRVDVLPDRDDALVVTYSSSGAAAVRVFVHGRPDRVCGDGPTEVNTTEQSGVVIIEGLCPDYWHQIAIDLTSTDGQTIRYSGWTVHSDTYIFAGWPREHSFVRNPPTCRETSCRWSGSGG